MEGTRGQPSRHLPRFAHETVDHHGNKHRCDNGRTCLALRPDYARPSDVVTHHHLDTRSRKSTRSAETSPAEVLSGEGQKKQALPEATSCTALRARMISCWAGENHSSFPPHFVRRWQPERAHHFVTFKRTSHYNFRAQFLRRCFLR